MIPTELTQRTIALPKEREHPIVVITGSSLRHDRFALRIQEEFGDSVVAWLQVTGKHSSRENSETSRPNLVLSQFMSCLRDRSKLRRVPRAFRRKLARCWVRMTSSRSCHAPRQIEGRLFGAEVARLRTISTVAPTPVVDPNANEVLELIDSVQPYFILTLGGPIYGPRLIELARGVALNQHDGWCPDYKGAKTVLWALYYRDLLRLGNTIHLLTSGMDAGPIVRRSTACVVPTDTPESCFVRSVALGTELMCEVVSDIKQTEQVTVFDQPPEAGSTFLSRQMTDGIKEHIQRDHSAGWLRSELERLRQF